MSASRMPRCPYSQQRHKPANRVERLKTNATSGYSRNPSSRKLEKKLPGFSFSVIRTPCKIDGQKDGADDLKNEAWGRKKAEGHTASMQARTTRDAACAAAAPAAASPAREGAGSCHENSEARNPGQLVEQDGQRKQQQLFGHKRKPQ
jgi:hypothetical protein